MLDPSKVMWLQWVLGITQILTLIALAVTVVLTWRTALASQKAAEAAAASVEESRLSRKESSDPRIALYFASPVSGLAEIVIENYGETTATDVTFAFTPALQASEQRDFVTRFFDSPKTLPPHRQLRHAIDTWPEYFKAGLPRRYDVTITFRRLGETVDRQETHVLDAGAFEHYSTWQIRGVHELAGRFEQFAGRLEAWAKETSSIREAAALRGSLIAEPRPFREAMSDLLAIAELLEAASNDKDAHLFPGVYLHSLRMHSVAALLAARREGVEPKIRDALQAFTLALYNRDWRYPQNHGAAQSRLETALADIRKVAAPPAT